MAYIDKLGPMIWAKKFLGGHFPDASLDSYNASQTPNLDSLAALKKNKGALDESAIMNDPLYLLDVQAADARYGGDGGSGTAAKVARAIAQNAYGGPSIDSLRAYGNEGQGKISSLYGALDQYLQGSAGQTAQLYQQGGQAINTAYDKSAADIAAAQATAAKNIQDQGNLGTVGAGAANESRAAADAAIRREAANLASNRANAQAGQAAMSEGQQAISRNFMSGAQTEKAAQSGKFQGEVNNMISKALQEMAAAQQRQSQAAESARASGAGSAGKNQAARIDALKNAVKRAQSQQEKGSKLSGAKGVLEYAIQNKRPDIAKKLFDMMGAAKMNAATQNRQAKLEKIKGNQTVETTTPDEQLQLLMAQSAPLTPDFGDRNLDPRDKNLMNLAKIPELSFLKQYMITSPEQARRQGQYQSAFGMSEEDYRKKGGRKDTVFQKELQSQASGPNQGILQLPMKAWHGIFGGGGDGGPSPQDSMKFENEMNQRFTPFLNLDALRRNTGHTKSIYDYYRKNDDTDLMTTLLEIYNGKYGVS